MKWDWTQLDSRGGDLLRSPSPLLKSDLSTVLRRHRGDRTRRLHKHPHRSSHRKTAAMLNPFGEQLGNLLHYNYPRTSRAPHAQPIRYSTFQIKTFSADLLGRRPPKPIRCSTLRAEPSTVDLLGRPPPETRAQRKRLLKPERVRPEQTNQTTRTFGRTDRRSTSTHSVAPSGPEFRKLSKSQRLAPGPSLARAQLTPVQAACTIRLPGALSSPLPAAA